MPNDKTQGGAAAQSSSYYSLGAPTCPKCSKPMVKRETKGPNGRRFWGCPSFPGCLGTKLF
jgi:ssDNA-binding Zn-finger/Zn-ribbon topoisomerase 1